MLKIIRRAFVVLFLIISAAFYQLYFSARPDVHTDPAILAGDGSTINYCDLPKLDGTGKLASEVPKAHTPGCSYNHFPAPILVDCTEPLADGVTDMRGLWIGVEGDFIGHVERVEQCGTRIVVTSAGIIHDLGPNSTGGVTSNDTEGSVLFSIGGKDYCPRTSAGIRWTDGVLNFQVFGWGPTVVKRYMDGDMMVWEYANGGVSHMKRICHLPEKEIIPALRGPRYKIW